MRLTQRSSNLRVSSGVKPWWNVWRRFLWDSIILATGATGTGKTLLVSKFHKCVSMVIAPFYLLTKNLAQLSRNASHGYWFWKFRTPRFAENHLCLSWISWIEDHLQLLSQILQNLSRQELQLIHFQRWRVGEQQLFGICDWGNRFCQAGGNYWLFHQHSGAVYGVSFDYGLHISTIGRTIMLQYVEIRGKWLVRLTSLKCGVPGMIKASVSTLLVPTAPKLPILSATTNGLSVVLPPALLNEKAELSSCIVKGFQDNAGSDSNQSLYEISVLNRLK